MADPNWSTPDIYVERIETARDVIDIYLVKALPVVPAAITSSLQRHELSCENRYQRECHDEILTQIDEIKSVRTAYSSMLASLQGAEKRAFETAYKAQINPQDLQNFLRAANRRLADIRDVRKNLDQLLNEGNNGHGVARKKVVLPKLDLKEFDGSDWETFWPLYESTIHNDTDLDDIQKMCYLDSLLKGEAKRCIQGFLPFSTANYKAATDLLIDKYGKNENLVRDLHNQLFRLPLSKGFEDDQKLQIDIEKICRQLEYYNQDISSPQVYLNLEQKISKKSLQRYVDLKASKMKTMVPPKWDTDEFRENFKLTLEQLQCVKDIYVRSAERGTESRGRKEKSVKRERESTLNLAVRYKDRDDRQRSSFHKYRDKDESRNNHSSNSSQSSSSSERKPMKDDNEELQESKGEQSSSTNRSRSPARYPCQFCSENHFAMDCEKYKTIEQRRERVNEQGFCYICLKSGHQSKDEKSCPRANKGCFLCKYKHHPALCTERWTKTEQSTSVITDKKSEESDVESSTVSATMKSCLKNPKEVQSMLKCIKATVYNPQYSSKRKRVLVFIDGGSEKSYISGSLAKELELMKIDEVKFKAKGLGGANLGEFVSPIVELGLKGKAIDLIIKARQLSKVMPKMLHVPFHKADIKKLMTNKLKIKPEMDEPHLLIGNDYHDKLAVVPLEELPNGFRINASKLGKFITGEGKFDLSVKSESSDKINCVISASSKDIEWEFTTNNDITREINDYDINRSVELHHHLETNGKKDAIEKEHEETWKKEFEEKVSSNGANYEVRLSWKEEFKESVSQQGFTIEEHEFQKFKSLNNNRNRRHLKSEENLDGEVRASQLAAEITARSKFADKVLRKTCQAQSRMMGEYILDSVLSNDLSQLNPTNLIRKLANEQLIEARWISSNILGYWPCSQIKSYAVIPYGNKCYQWIPMNSPNDQPVLAFLDPLTHIAYSSSIKESCNSHHTSSVMMNKQLLKVDQITGESSIIRNIANIEIHNKAWEAGLPPTDLQIFRLLVITNLSQPQSEMMKALRSFRTNSLDSPNHHHSLGGGSPSELLENHSALSLIWNQIDPMNMLIRVVVLINISIWALKVYLWGHKKWTIKEVKKEVKKEIKKYPN